MLIPPLDRAIAALIEDLNERGLYETTLVVAMGEFGRTPRMNEDAGRDHWGQTFSVLMGCGGMKMGQVIGRSSERGEKVVDRPISPRTWRRPSITTWGSTPARLSSRIGPAPHLPDRERRADRRASRLNVPTGTGSLDRRITHWDPIPAASECLFLPGGPSSSGPASVVKLEF